MICPKCQEGQLKRVFLKKNKEVMYLCDVCGTAWEEDDVIGETTGSSIRSFTQDEEDKEYSIDMPESEDDSIMRENYR